MSRIPDWSARSFPPRIGSIIIPTDPFWIQVLEAMLYTNQKIGDQLILLQPAATQEDMQLIPVDDLVDQVLAYDLDALICTIVSTPLLQALAYEKLPVLCLAEIDFRHPLVTSLAGMYPGGKMAGEFIGRELGGKGHAVCVTAGLEGILVRGQARLAGFEDGLKAFPDVSTDHLPAYWSYARAYPALLETFKTYPRQIDAIFGVSDTVILAARDAALKLGVIDESAVLVGINGDPIALAAIEEGTLDATIDTSSEDFGARCMELAHRAALGEALPELLHQTYELITLKNVAGLATRKLSAIARIPNQMVGYNRQLEQDRLSQLEISMEITRQIGSLLERKQLSQVFSRLVRQYYGYDWMRILRWSDADGRLVFYEGDSTPASQQVPIEQDSLLHQVFELNKTIFIPDTQKSHRWQMSKEWEAIRSRAILPIPLGEKVIGVLDLQSRQPVRQPSMEVVGLRLLAGQLGIALQNADLYLEALQAREAAERANQLKTRLVANVGHEMRTPLNAILGFSQSIRKKMDSEAALDADELQQDVRHIYQSGEHLMYMINDLLDLSRAEIGALNLYFEPLLPLPFLKDLFANFSRPSLATSEVNWVLDVPEQLPVIRADVVRLRQVLINLLANARKFTSHGTITLGAAVELPHLHLWVQDTGKGVPADLQEKIFEPFSTTGRKRRPEGIGLGLSITRHLVALHEGVITLESKPGSGSTFHVYLPLPGVSRDSARKPEPGGASILLVLTEQSGLPGEIQEICARHSLTACRVTSRESLSEAMAAGVPAAIAWDLAYVSPKSWNMIYRLSSNPKYAALPVILFGDEQSGHPPDAGLTHIMFKPCGGNSLKEWIGQVNGNLEEESVILIVDDDAHAREYYQSVLGSIYPKNRVISVADGSQAVELMQYETPALVLLDLLMPMMDGFEVLEWVRSNSRVRRVPVIIISEKLLTYEDVQRLNHLKTYFYTKDILTDKEIIGLLGQAESEANPLPQPTSMLIKQALLFIHQNYYHPISRKEVAASVGVSENYLSQIFRQEMTISPWDYLSRLRIKMAKELLQESDASVTQVAIQVGFNDPAYFSRVFRKMTGKPPQAFRQSRR